MSEISRPDNSVQAATCTHHTLLHVIVEDGKQETAAGNMKIQNHAPYQLSNYEVLNHILSVREDLEEQASHRYREKARSDAELLLKYPMEKEFRKPDEPDPPRPEDFPVQTDELKELEEQAKRRGDMDAARWMSERVIKYLGNWYMPTYRQHAEGIFAMVHDLQDLDMSKGEILQVVNTIPTSEVEVYTCIQGLEERYPSDEEQADFYANVLHIVNTHTSADADDGLPERTEQYSVPAKGSGVMMHQGNGDMEEEEEAMAMNGGAGAYGEEEYAEGEGEGGYYQEDDGMMGGDDYVHEAEWGADKEGGVDDDVPEMD